MTKLLLLAALSAGPAPAPAPAPTPAPGSPPPARAEAKARARTDPMPRGSRILVVGAGFVPVALEQLAGARGWKLDAATAPGPAIAAARAGKHRLLVVSAGLVDARSLGALRAAAPGAKLILTLKEGERLPEPLDPSALEILTVPYETVALEAAVARVLAPPEPPTAEKKQRLAETRSAQRERRERARRIAALTVDRILSMAEPLEGEGEALAQLVERLRGKEASTPARLTTAEQDLLLAFSALELGLDGLVSRREGDRANATAEALRRAGFEAEASALEEGMRLLSGHGRLGRKADRLQARLALDAPERARWAELSATLESARAAGPGRLLEYARAQRKALRLDRHPPPAAGPQAGPAARP